MTCPNDSRLLAFDRGEATPEEDRHIHDCPACQQKLPGLRDELEAIAAEARAAAVLPPVEPDVPSTVDPIPPLVGAGIRLGRYLLHDEIGHGGMGDVYEATQDGTARRVALKVLRPN